MLLVGTYLSEWTSSSWLPPSGLGAPTPVQALLGGEGRGGSPGEAGKQAFYCTVIHLLEGSVYKHC